LRVRLQFFGLVKDAAGADHAFLEISDAATVADAVQAARGAIEGLRGLKAQVRYAVNAEYCADSSALKDGDTLSFIPPVGGG
jgi:molybdopterin converting factor small subunit